jgi:acetylornithine deacetylase/succinyl-diaminopimelate desuccinylase-like protein
MSHNSNLDAVLAKIDADLDVSLDRLMGLLRLQSVSTDPAYKDGINKAADWLVADLASLGVDASKRETPLHPIVIGHVGNTGPHLLFYGHYDVQPVDPIDLWDHDPFAPFIEDRDGKKVIRGRGTADDKGQLMTFMEACRAWIAVNGELPCKISFLFEGEEETGSPSLVPFMHANADELKADLALICDTGMVAPGVPSIASQLRGMLKEEFTLHGPAMDLHSGHYGGPAINPLREISRIIASFHDDQGRVTIDGFYDDVIEIGDNLLAQWETCGFNEADYMSGAGLTTPAGEKGYSVLEQQWSRPTLEINGLWGGYQGAGSKTVIPADAHCKITCRLVCDMDPHMEQRPRRRARICHEHRPPRIRTGASGPF